MNTNTLYQVCDEIFLPPYQLELPEFLSPMLDPSGGSVDHKGRVHHPYSPSKLNSLEACQRFRQGDSDNEASRRGTLQHEAFKTGDDSVLTDEEVENVNRCREYVREIETRFVKPMRLQALYVQRQGRCVNSGRIRRGCAGGGDGGLIQDLELRRWAAQIGERQSLGPLPNANQTTYFNL